VHKFTTNCVLLHFPPFSCRLTTSKGMAEVKAAGRYRQEGKAYVVENGDIIHFRESISQP
jgi:hypothetical protein